MAAHEHDGLAKSVAAIRHGDKYRGRGLILQVLENDPRNEAAWSWAWESGASYGGHTDCQLGFGDDHCGHLNLPAE